MIELKRTDPEKWRCPVDEARLTLVQTHAGGIGTCPKCYGLWMPPEAIERASEILDRIPATTRRRARIEKEIDEELACSYCGERMRRVVIEGTSLDVCPNCRGVWLDRGEFDAVWSWFGIPHAERIPAESTRTEQGGFTAETIMMIFETIISATDLFA